MRHQMTIQLMVLLLDDIFFPVLGMEFKALYMLSLSTEQHSLTQKNLMLLVSNTVHSEPLFCSNHHVKQKTTPICSKNP